jgi:hypothetical protein
MTNALQYICDSEGQTVSAVPIAFWQELMAERETAYLLSSPAMKERLLKAKNVKMESLWNQPVKNLEFDADAFEDLAWWIESDRKKALKIIKLIREVQPL